jgi:hypothetical protein
MYYIFSPKKFIDKNNVKPIKIKENSPWSMVKVDKERWRQRKK